MDYGNTIAENNLIDNTRSVKMKDSIIFENNEEGIIFEFHIAGYQFPTDLDSGCEYDLNWLFIAGTVKHPIGNWSFRDPCLLTPEVLFMADWFEAVENETETQKKVITLENQLMFELLNKNEVRTLRVLLDSYLLPPGPQKSIEIDFPVTELDLSKHSKTLRRQLKEHNYKKRPMLTHPSYDKP